MSSLARSIALPSFVLGYHGCDAALAEEVLAGRAFLLPSQNDYDWLGHGIYFWEHNSERAQEWAEEAMRRKGPVAKSAIVGAVINLGSCLNLLDSANLGILSDAYQDLVGTYADSGEPLPTNENPRGAAAKEDYLLRKLDCAVVNHAVGLAARTGMPFDTVRSLFVEGKPLYPDAGFREKNHIQICVVNPAAVVAYFRQR